MKNNIKELLISIAIPLCLGILVSILTATSMNYNNMVKPVFSPPAFLFPIVWTIIYILMGISSYLIYSSNNYYKDKALVLYISQLLVNLLWSFFFFSFEWYLFSFLWLILLIVLVILMIIHFYKINKISAYIQIPYLLWISYAAILNFSVFLLNR
jgi:tryptophan-rich sensory protein